MEVKKCSVCGKSIPKGRLKVLPSTKTCVKCSDTSKLVGVITEAEVLLVDAAAAKRIKFECDFNRL